MSSSALLTNRSLSVPRIRLVHRVDDFIERHPVKAFAALSIFYLLTVFCLSWVKLLWLDELITLHIARLNSFKAIWSTLAIGADPNPPLYHWAVMVCRRLFGEHTFVLRLPSVFGYWVGMLALFLFLKRHIPNIWALAGTVISMGMGGFEWSYESRSYALFYGFTMLAFYCWSLIPEARAGSVRRYTALIGMGMALACCLCTNYFAVMAFFPVAAAELTRMLQRAKQTQRQSKLTAIFHKIDWPVWLALIVAATPFLIFRSFIKKSIALYADYAWNKVSVDRAIYGYLDMVEGMRYLLFVLILFAVAVHLLGKLNSEDRKKVWPRALGKLAEADSRVQTRTLLSFPEAAGVSVFVAYPFVGYALASLHGGMLSPRFVIPVCFGFAIVGALSIYRTFGHLRAAGIGMLVLFGIWFATRESYVGYQYEVQKESFYRVLQHVPAPQFPGQPLVISDNLLILPVQYYAPPEMKARIIYAIDFPAIVRERGEASGEVNLWAGRHTIYDFPIIPIATLQKNASTYLILTSGHEWLVNDLERHRYTVAKLPIDSESSGLELWATPLSHSYPVYFLAAGDKYDQSFTQPIPFIQSHNLP